MLLGAGGEQLQDLPHVLAQARGRRPLEGGPEENQTAEALCD